MTIWDVEVVRSDVEAEFRLVVPEDELIIPPNINKEKDGEDEDGLLKARFALRVGDTFSVRRVKFENSVQRGHFNVLFFK